jgi:hypothetical protein
MRSHPLPWLLLVVSLLPGCSLFVDFDLEGQPCDDAGMCLQGYVCNRGVCHSNEADGGTGGQSLCEDPAGCSEPPEAR